MFLCVTVHVCGTVYEYVVCVNMCVCVCVILFTVEEGYINFVRGHLQICTLKCHRTEA